MRNPTFSRLIAPLLALALFAVAEAEGSVPAKAGKRASNADCNYTYNGLAFDRADKRQSYWKVDLKIHNPTRNAINLESMRYFLLHGKDTLLTDWKPANTRVLPGETSMLQTILSLPNKVLKKLPQSTLRDTDARFTLVGDAFLEGRQGKVELPRVVHQIIHVDMPKQVSKAKKMLLRNALSV